MNRELTFEPFDCDNHYYESEDAFTRHVPEEMRARVVQWAEVNGRKYHVVGGKLSKAVTTASLHVRNIQSDKPCNEAESCYQ